MKTQVSTNMPILMIACPACGHDVDLKSHVYPDGVEKAPVGEKLTTNTRYRVKHFKGKIICSNCNEQLDILYREKSRWRTDSG